MTGLWLGLSWPPTHSSIAGVAAVGVARALFGLVYMALAVITNKATLLIGWRLAMGAIKRRPQPNSVLAGIPSSRRTWSGVAGSRPIERPIATRRSTRRGFVASWLRS